MLNYDDRFLRFSFAIDQIAKSLQKIKNEKLAKFGLKSMHLMCLFQLHKNTDGLTGTELARSCNVDKAFISRITGELAESGYVTYSNPEGSRYNNRFILTESGCTVMLEVRSILEKSVERVVSGVTEEQLTQFYHILEQLNSSLTEISGEA